MEIGGKDEKPGTSASSDGISDTEQPAHMYRVLGHDTFVNLKKIHVVPKWISKGETFTSELNKEDCAELEFVNGLHPLLAGCVRTHLKKWYPVQKATLPHLIGATAACSILPPRDLVISAPTGSGKTLCYVLPILNALRERTPCSVFALIIAPVQNLVDQIEKEFRKYNVFNVRIVSLCANHDLKAERQQLKGANVAVATPGRLMEHITDPDCPVDFSRLRYLVVDEADRMSHTARIEWLNDLEAAASYNHNCVTIDDLFNASFLQKILVSATLSLDIEDLREWRLRHPRLFRAVKKGVMVTTESAVNSVTVPSSLKIEAIICDAKLKPLAIYERMERKKSWKKILIFVNSRVASYRLAVLLKILCAGRYQIEELSSNLFGNRRRKVLARFKKGTTKVLISSDVMSRGIDVENVDVVVNYDKPQNERLFVHRVGRTARCGRKGIAISLVSTREKRELQNTLRKVGFSGEIKEKSFDGVKDAETEEIYRRALSDLKETVQNIPRENGRKIGHCKRRPK